MTPVAEAFLPARDPNGSIRAHLHIALLPREYPGVLAPLVTRGTAPAAADSGAGLEVVEDCEYRYEWQYPEPGHVTSDPEEVFQPDAADGRRGRLRPGRSTGTMLVGLRRGDEVIAQLELEVRSRKLDYLSEYRWMLRDIAEVLSELVMDRFAASRAQFVIDSTRDAVTLYQRFAFLRSLLQSESFRGALDEITRRPHVAWVEEHEPVLPGQSAAASSQMLRQLCMAGPRTPWPGGPIVSMPFRLDRRRTEATFDTTPNRFVRFALERWIQVIADIDHALSECEQSPAVARGRREIKESLEHLAGVLNCELFKELAQLHRFPADDQVLQRREGYRDVFRAYLEFELAARLSWRGSASTYAAGQRDVAALYEYWAFIQFARVVARLAGRSFNLAPLVEAGASDLNVALERGKETVLEGTIERLGRRLHVSLCFNRTFSQGTAPFGSWTKPMRPDYSVIIRAAENEAAAFEPIVLHFDAKYRVNQIAELFGQGDEVVGDEEDASDAGRSLARRGPLRADLLKMHAYRDAIRRSAGAYVLFPGDDCSPPYQEYHELLPGLGAFVLRPSPSGDARGASTLHIFLEAVFDHVATRLTTHERGRYWNEKIFGRDRLDDYKCTSERFFEPRPDTSVLLGYVKNEAHWNWIRSRMTYNLRTEGRLGGVSPNAPLLLSQLLLLYCVETERIALARIISDPEIVEKEAIRSTGYPSPRGDYLCVQFSWLSDQQLVSGITAKQIDDLVRGLGHITGQPTPVHWAQIASLSGRPQNS